MTDTVPLSKMEEIQILMVGYNTLRTEVLRRNTVGFQALGVAGTASVGLMAYAFTQRAMFGVILLIGLPILIWVVYRLIDFDTRAAATRKGGLRVFNRLPAGGKSA